MDDLIRRHLGLTCFGEAVSTSMDIHGLAVLSWGWIMEEILHMENSTQVYGYAWQPRCGKGQESFLHWEIASFTLHAIAIGLFPSCVFLSPGHKNAHTQS